MSEDKTADQNGAKMFEERVFMRFDSLEYRLEKLKMKQYDTKPIWEQALAALTETNQRLQSFDVRFDAIDAKFVAIDQRFDAIDAKFDAIDQRFDAIDAKFDAIDAKFIVIDQKFEVLSTDLDNGLRGVERKIDVLNQYILDLRADQRYVDSRLEKIEAQAKPS